MNTRTRTRFTAWTLLLAISCPAWALAAEKAPELAPDYWLNTKKEISWSSLRGRVVLVERWATWCGPCRAQIPHLNELKEKYESKGLVIIGLTDEPKGLVEPFVEAQGMEYVIAGSRGEAYSSPTIPAAWLVTTDGEVAWSGHPASLKESSIEEELKTARMSPRIEVPDELEKAREPLEKEEWGEAVKELERALKSKPSEEVAAAAKKAIEAVKAWGEDRLKLVDELAKEGEYLDGINLLVEIQKGFKGMDIADRARDKHRDWEKDRDIKEEVLAAKALERGHQLMRQKKAKAALSYYTAVARKFPDTHAGKEAAELAKKLEREL